MAGHRVFVLCPDYDSPSGGVRRLYRHVDVLCHHGLDAALLHEKPGFRCSWFTNETRIATLNEIKLTPDDFLVVPEVLALALPQMAPGVPKVVFNQNAYFTFRGFPVDGPSVANPYACPDLVGVFAVSDDNAAYLRYAFPGLNVWRLHYGIDPFFAPRWPKRRAIAYMPRKNAEDVVQVINLLRYRGALAGWDLVPIDGLNEGQVAQHLADCAIFLSFGTVEGCPLPPLEAMASGCVVIGYHGRGGREYFDPAFSYPVEPGDVVTFARAIETVLAQEQKSPGMLEHLGKRAATYVVKHFSPEREEHDIVTAWRAVLGSRQSEFSR